MGWALGFCAVSVFLFQKASNSTINQTLSLDVFQVTRLGMFEVHCDELIRGLSKRADTLCNRLLGRMSKDHQEANKG